MKEASAYDRSAVNNAFIKVMLLRCIDRNDASISNCCSTTYRAYCSVELVRSLVQVLCRCFLLDRFLAIHLNT